MKRQFVSLGVFSERRYSPPLKAGKVPKDEDPTVELRFELLCQMVGSHFTNKLYKRYEFAPDVLVSLDHDEPAETVVETMSTPPRWVLDEHRRKLQAGRPATPDPRPLTEAAPW